jgi:hypothetical protein
METFHSTLSVLSSATRGTQEPGLCRTEKRGRDYKPLNHEGSERSDNLSLGARLEDILSQKPGSAEGETSANGK